MEQTFFRHEVKMVSRGAGQSLVAAAAYRTGLAMTCERTGAHHDYPRKERIDAVEILAPDDAPDWALDPHKLCNSIERHEKRRDAQLARDHLLCLPHELSFEQGLGAVRAFCASEFVAQGFVVQLASHGYKADPKTGRRSWHIHLLVSERPLVDGKWATVKDRARNSFRQLHRWRRRLAYFINQALIAAGKLARVEHRSAAALGVERLVRHLQYGFWKRAAAAAERARAQSLKLAAERSTDTMPRPPVAGAPIQVPLIETRPQWAGLALVGRVAGAFKEGTARAAETGRELSLFVVARAHALIEARKEERRDREAAREAEKRAEAEWQAREAERRARDAHETRLAALREAMYDHARERRPRLAYARAWEATADNAILLNGQTIADYGASADRAALGALVLAGGDETDLYEMAGRSPHVVLLPDIETRRAHTSRVIGSVRRDPELAAALAENERASAAAHNRSSPAREHSRVRGAEFVRPQEVSLAPPQPARRIQRSGEAMER